MDVIKKAPQPDSKEQDHGGNNNSMFLLILIQFFISFEMAKSPLFQGVSAD